MWISHGSGGWKFKSKVLALQVPSEASLPADRRSLPSVPPHSGGGVSGEERQGVV